MKDIWKKLSIIEKIKLILGIIAGIFVVIFATLNWKDQEIHFIFNTLRVKLSIAIILSVLSGYIISFLFSYLKINSLKNENEKLKDKIADLSQELNEKTEN
jgi:putative membrane protein